MREKWAIKRTIDLWIERHPKLGGVVWMHYNGKTVTEIDVELGYNPGTARRCMVKYWQFCKELEEEGLVTYDDPEEP